MSSSADSGERNERIAESNEQVALRAKIESIVQLKEDSIVLAGRELTWLRVSNPDVLLDVAANNTTVDPESIDPFWAATWRAAQGLDRFLQGLPLSGTRVLELGCGSGQAGVGAALQGAQVTSTDSVELALQVAELNAWPYRDRIEHRVLVWEKQTLDVARFPVIIGSDLVYDPNLFSALNVCARSHLAGGGRLYLSEPHRHTGDKFSQWVREAGWATVEHDVDMEDDRVPIRIFECWLD